MSTYSVLDRRREFIERNRYRIGAVVAAVLAALAVAVWAGVPLERIFTAGFVERSIGAAMPIALAAVGGLYAEKSGVFNIGLEGFMIFGAVNAVAIAYLVSGGGSVTQLHLWTGLVGAVLISVLYTIVFAVLMIRYKADQIVAGLAVWFLGLGFGPFTAVVIWDSQSSPTVGRIARLEVPVLSELPVVGELLFNVSPLVVGTFVIVSLSWYVLYHTRFGYWIQAAGENPGALDTAGVDVNRVRYATVIFSGAMAGLGGAVLAIGLTTSFVGSGLTMVDGRGWIGIVAYLFGNYNPIGAALAALLFGAADMFQVQLQTVGIEISATLMGLLPYVVVILVLTFYGRTRMPSHVGEPYESEE
ncbi:ABC transporter permease [Natrialbaceae archaeon A-gly3]